MIVCVCHRVSDREIARHARAGRDFDDIQLELGVATQCGRCESCARAVVAQCRVASPVACIQAGPSAPASGARESAWSASPSLQAA